MSHLLLFFVRMNTYFDSSFVFSDGAVVSGARSSSDVLIYIDMPLAMSDGIQFFKSSNGVILTRGLRDSGILPPKYFSSVLKRSSDGSLAPLSLAVD